MSFRLIDLVKPPREGRGQMLKFYRIAFGSAIILTIVSSWILHLGATHSRLHISLLPKYESPIAWFPDKNLVVPDGATELTVEAVEEYLNYSFVLSSEARYPYAGYTFNFAAIGAPEATIDLRRFPTATFEVRCDPQNVLMFVLFTLDDAVTNFVDSATRRVSWSFFSCDNEFSLITIPLNETQTPDWWLNQHNLDFSSREYNLGKVFGVAIANSIHSPRETASNVILKNLEFHGEDMRYFYAGVTLATGMWIFFAIWLVRFYIRVLIVFVKDRVKQDRPIIAYQELSIAPHKDKTTRLVLGFMATEYANPDVSFDMATDALGLSRAKINAILKEEIGLHFNAYLNKLRLTEAARILSQEPDAGITEIAYAVGYNNVTYFNKLFKDEYGCSPRTFKSLYKEGEAGSGVAKLEGLHSDCS